MTTNTSASKLQTLGQAQLLAQADTGAPAVMGNTGHSVVNLVPGQAGSIKIQAGQHLAIRRPAKHGVDVQSEVPDNLIASRRGDALNIRYADGSTLTIENFYAACTDNSVCSVNLASDNTAGIDFAANSSSGGTTAADGGVMVYAHGSHDVLMAMANGQDRLLITLGELGNTGVQTYLPQSFSALPFLIGAGALALAAGQNGSSGSDSGAPNPEVTIAALAQDAIKRAAEGNTASGTSPSESTYLTVGITGVDATNLAAINSALNSDPVTGASVDSKTKIQALVDAYKTILFEANGATPDTTPNTNPNAAQYATIGADIGAAATDPEALALLNDIVGAQISSGVDTVNEINELARIANAITSQAAGISGLTMAELSAIGITGVGSLSPVNVQNVLNAISGTPDNGTGVDSLAKLQALVDGSIDLTPPTKPLAAPISYLDNVGSITSTTSTAATTDDPTPGINIGALPVGVAGAVLYVDGFLVPASYDAGTGVLTPTSPVTSGVPHKFGFGYVDAAGNTSTSSPTIAITVDTTAPEAAVIKSYTDNVGTGLAVGKFPSGTTTDDTTLLLSGTFLSSSDSGFDNVKIYDGATLLGSATMSGNNWVFALPLLTDGSTHSYSAIASDAVGNVGAASNAFTLAVSSPYERLSNANIIGSIAGWTTNTPGGTGAIFQNNGSDGTVAFNTAGTSAGASVYQTVSHLIVGQSYTVQYQLQNSLGTASNTIVSTAHDGATWNAGTQLATQTYAQALLTATFHSYTFTATSDTATLVFTNTIASDTTTSDLLLNQASIMTSDEVARHAATPLVLDLNDDGVKTVAAEHGVLFDVTNTNTVALTGWVNANDALLVRDINLDGVINNGSELFGNGTQLADGSHAANGFAALTQFDANHDGKIDMHDAVFQELKVWRDANGDGVSQAKELLSLANLGIASFNLSALEGNAVENGNVHGLVSSYRTTDGATHELADVWFQQVEPVIHHSAVI